MAELELRRTAGDRRLYALDGVGTLRLTGWGSRSATAEASDRTWQLSGEIFKQTLKASDASGASVGEFEDRSFGRGGTLRWAGREIALRPSGISRQRFAMVDIERELATFEACGWGKHPVRIDVHDDVEFDLGLLLFGAFVVNKLACDASAADAS